MDKCQGIVHLFSISFIWLRAFKINKVEVENLLENGVLTILLKGDWVSGQLAFAQSCLSSIQSKPYKNIQLELAHLAKIDTSGVWLIEDFIRNARDRGIVVKITGQDTRYHELAERVSVLEPKGQDHRFKQNFLGNMISNLGEGAIDLLSLTLSLIEFLGRSVVALGRVLVGRGRLRFVSIVSHFETMGINALPIIITMSIAIGLVLSYQGADQLRRLGVEVYTINLVSISIVREVGILITAIMVAGRTGSAITAQIGTMKLNQEIDALNTMGLNPMEILVVPRIIALVLLMPLLAFVSDVAGCIGGALFVLPKMDVSMELYLNRIGEAVTMWSFWIGLIKAPVFGFIIAIVSCFEGFQVSGGAVSVGDRTTRSVVESIFLVIISDALLSIFFVELGI